MLAFIYLARDAILEPTQQKERQHHLKYKARNKFLSETH